MTREELIRRLREIKEELDQEMAHIEADKTLIEFIADPEIADEYNALEKWYA